MEDIHSEKIYQGMKDIHSEKNISGNIWFMEDIHSEKYIREYMVHERYTF